VDYLYQSTNTSRRTSIRSTADSVVAWYSGQRGLCGTPVVQRSVVAGSSGAYKGTQECINDEDQNTKIDTITDMKKVWEIPWMANVVSTLRGLFRNS
jgi:hypothetical protein